MTSGVDITPVNKVRPLNHPNLTSTLVAVAPVIIANVVDNVAITRELFTASTGNKVALGNDTKDSSGIINDRHMTETAFNHAL